MELSAFSSFATAYPAALDVLLRNGERVTGVRDQLSVGSGFGEDPRDTVELRPFGYSIERPHASLITAKGRRLNLPFIVAHWLWAMRGSARIAEIVRYNPRGAPFSDDGTTLNAAVGARLRRPIDQVGGVLATLKADPTTRRAQMVVGRPEDALARSRDISCPTAIQAFLRNGRLEVAVTMRSQSAFGVLPYDAAFFMWLHCWLAAVLGVEPGPHSVVAWSFHVYVDEIAAVERLLKGAPPVDVSLPPFSQPYRGLQELWELEGRIAAAIGNDDRGVLEDVLANVARLEGAERAFAATLAADATFQAGLVDLHDACLSLLPTAWRSLMEDREPTTP